MTPEDLSRLISDVLTSATSQGDGAINLDPAAVPELVKVERPRNRDHGDWSTNVAMQLGKKAGMAPRDLATLLADRLAHQSGIASAEVAGPGFLNIRLEAGAAGELARTILEAGTNYGTSTAHDGEAVNLEYVSANPTGPIHIGGARWAAVGDSLARILAASGATVTREYYFNDHGAQIDRFSRSLLASARGQEAPEDGYAGAYITDIAKRVTDIETAKGNPAPAELGDQEAQETFREVGVGLMFDDIKATLATFGVEFDVYFHEDELHETGAVERAISTLRERGHVFESDGATWIRTTDFGDDKDRVVIKSDGDAAYFAGDLAYYLNKRERGADYVVIMLGADHHGYVGRMYAMAQAFGDEAGPGKNMEILIGQLVNLVKGGQPLRMSKRAGTVLVLEDLIELVGVDAARYSLVRSSVDTTLEIDLDVVTSHTADNPVYYVQYAHARTQSVAANAASHGVTGDDFDPAALDTAADADLLGNLARFPEVVAQAGALREPHRVARYLEELAAAYHGWYGKTRVTPRADESVTVGHHARLWLNNATAQVLRNGLGLLGVSAPERM